MYKKIYIYIYIIYIYIYLICIYIYTYVYLSQFRIHKSQHNRHLLVFVGKLMFLKCSCQKPLKNNCGRAVFLEKLQAARNFLKFSQQFNKIPNFLRPVLQTYSAICIFFVCFKKESSRSSQQRLILKCQGNLVMKLLM